MPIVIMRVITAIVFFLLYTLIKIGDFVIWVFEKAKKTILYCIQNLFDLPRKLLSKLFKARRKHSGIFIISKQKKKGDKRTGLFLKLFDFFSKTLRNIDFLINLFLLVITGIGDFFKSISRIVIKSIIFLLRLPLRVLKKILRKLKRALKRKTYEYKVPFLYKIRLLFIGAMASFIFVFLPLLATVFLSELPNPGNLSVNYIPKTTKIFDRNGSLLYEIFANQNRTIVKLSDIPKAVRDATIAIEDKDFYNHPGFDLKAIFRALLSNASGKDIQGGSTITQQLIKSAFFSPEPSISRKVKEVILAFWTEQIYTKDRILELYLNYVPYGGTAWGIESASEIYFGKKASELDLAESAFLAGLPRAPSIYSPYSGNDVAWQRRQKEVLDAMVKNNFISEEEKNKALEKELSFKIPSTPIRAPHFVMYIKDLLIKKYGINAVERGGLQVRTTLDLSIQEKAQRIVAEQVLEDSNLGIGNGASLITNPSNGDILAMVGSRDYFDEIGEGNVNIITSLRQPGSTIKLVTYTLALSNGLTEATILDDTPLTIYLEGEPPYVPVNYDGAFHGRIPLRTAFANSFNIPAVRTAQRMGIANIVNFGREMGISSWRNANQYGISITLGGGEVTMLDLATAYGTVANKGVRTGIDPFLQISDSDGKVIYRKIKGDKQVVDPGVAFIISDILADNKARSLAFGPNSPLNIPGVRASVKTGTTDNKRDNWTIGYTTNLLVATWVGNNDNTPMSPNLTSGITGAAPMWSRIMKELVETPQASSSALPSNVIKKSCLGQDRLFVKGTESSVVCSITKPTPTPSPTP